MAKILLKINRVLFGKVLVAVFLFLSFSGVALAGDTQINAGLLSDIWFSKLEIKNDDKVSIYGSFQNTSGKSLTGEVSFWVNDKEIEKKNFSVDDNHVVKLETSWKTEVGDFDIKIVVNSLKVDDKETSVNSLIKKEALVKIKIKREITVEYVKEIGTNVYKDTVKVVNKVVENANQSLETIKVRETSDVRGSSDGGDLGVGSVENSNSDESGDVKGIQYSKDEVDGLNKDNSAGKKEVSGDVVTDLKNRPFDALRNFAISILQFILKYWQISLGVLLLLIFLLFLKRKFSSK